MIPNTVWSELTPAGSDQINAGDNRVREMKTQVREVIAVDHLFASSGQSTTTGYHKQITLIEAADIGTGASGVPILGAQTVSGKPELIYTDEDDNDVQISSNGKIKLSSGRLENNTNLTARNAANSGDINIIKVNSSDIVEIPTICQLKNASVMESSAAPTTDAMIANKKYVDDNIVSFKTRTTPNAGSIYQASTDGILDVGANVDSRGYILCDTSNPPTTFRTGWSRNGASGIDYSGASFSVISGEYYKVVVTDGSNPTINFTPIS